MLTKKTRVPQPRKSSPSPGENPRRQPSQARSRETVQVILEAAARVLESRGLPGFNTNAVAERAGVSIGSLYQYFPNKDALTLALIATFEAELRESIERSFAASRGRDLRTSLALYLEEMYAVHHRRAALHRILEVEEERLRSAIPEQPKELESVILHLLQEHQDELRTPASAAAAEDVFTIARSMTDAALQSGAPPAVAHARVLRAVCGYLLWQE